MQGDGKLRGYGVLDQMLHVVSYHVDLKVIWGREFGELCDRELNTQMYTVAYLRLQ
jgi:hypothetical protein